GPRPYEPRILAALGDHFRRYSLYSEAAATEELALRRFPLRADAVVSARRLIETHERSNQGDLARAAGLRYAPQFAPGSEWSKAQASDSARADGAEFA